MTPPPTIAERRPEVVTREIPSWREGWTTAATSADHKVVAKLFMGTSLSFLAIAALTFALARIQLIVPDSTIMRPDIFAQMSATAMVSITVLFAVPFVLGLLGYIVPLQIGARSVALPRLNQLAYWLYAAGALVYFVSFLYLAPETGLAPQPPMSDDLFSPSGGVDAWIGGVGLATLGFICWSINMIATLKNMRAPGMAWRRAPVLAWAARVVSYVLLITGAAMVAALVMLTVDRQYDGVFFDAGLGGEPMLFSHLSWLYFTGIHTVMVVTALAVISEIIPTFSRKPLFSHSAVAGSLVAVGVLGTLAWMQNLYASPLAEGFAFFTMLVAILCLVPIGLVYIVWTMTMWNGAVSTRAPLVLAITGAVALVTGLAGELATSVVGVGLLLENTVAAQQDTILVITGFVLAMFAALHYWLPKVTGRAVHEGPAKAAAALIFVSALTYGLAMFLAGVAGQPVDVFRYFEDDGVSTLNLIASIASFFFFVGIFIELVNLVRSYSGGRPVGHDPWQGTTLEWFALSPPPAHNFDAVPDVRSAEPLSDIREAIRERKATFVPPEPLEATEPPEPEIEGDTPTADPEDIVSEEAEEPSAGSDPETEVEAEEPSAGSDPETEAEETAEPVEGSDPTVEDDAADSGADTPPVS
ncbi:MAG: cytochrome c oxidase subunit [Solirubrobacterales bacterium]|nr:cytochrome c oxidase subunit [Solirubrobacterales bacterium]